MIIPNIRRLFKGLDQVDKVPEELWTEPHNIVYLAVIKIIPKKKKKCKKANGCLMSQKSTSNKCWRECGEKGTLLHCWWECKLVQPLWRTVWRFL